MRIRIVAVDDNPEFLSALRSLLERDFDVLETAADGKSGLDTIRRCQPDVAIVDLTMPGLNGIEVTREINKHSVRPAVLLCSVESDPEILEAAWEAGAQGYIFKPRLEEDLIEAVNSAARGRSFCSPLSPQG